MRVFLLKLVVAASLLPNLANAGEVVLESDNWNYICEVEVTTGIDAPNSDILEFTDVRDGWKFSAEDKMCFRRSRDPRICGGGLTLWTCATQITSGTNSISLN